MNLWPSQMSSPLAPAGIHHPAMKAGVAAAYGSRAGSGIRREDEDPREIPGTKIQRLVGRTQNWIMPIMVVDAPDGYNTTGVDHVCSYHAFEWHLMPAAVHRVLPSGQSVETLSPNGFVVRPAHSTLAVVAHGPSKFAQFCTSDSEMRKVAVDWIGDAGDRDGLLSCERVMRTDAAIAPMLDQYFRRALDADEPPTRLEMDSRAHLLLLQVLKSHSVLAEKKTRAPRGGLAPYQLKRVCEMMTADLAEEVSLSSLASTVGVSYHHFCHAFKASTGVAPHRWLVERRVEKACELLRTTAMSITEIASVVGYEDPNQLLRIFRTRRSTTPAAYRRDFHAQGLCGRARA
jgi:AraC family transcriptional regulator